MLVLGIQKNGRKKKVVHVDDVPNGFKCGCICPNPECADQLSAKNNCKDMSNHFAHQTRVEGRTCLMSQLHLAAQHFFLPLKSITLPKQVFRYDGSTLEVPPRTVEIERTELEAPINKFRVDVLLHTEIGQIIIEILVTSKCSDEKTTYFRTTECPTLEYDLSLLVDKDLNESISLLATSTVPYKWIYGWSQAQVIDDYVKNKEAVRKKELAKLRKSALKSAKKFITDGYLLLPSIDEQMECTLEGVLFEDKVRLFTRKEFKLSSLEIDCEHEEYLLLKGKASNSQGSRLIWAAYMYTLNIPDEIKAIKDAVVVRIPTGGSRNIATWCWLNNPKLNQLRAEKMNEFKERCSIDLALRESTRQYSDQLMTLAIGYSDNQDDYFHHGYGMWKKWLIENNFFRPTPSKKNPPIPALIKTHRKHPHLWMFDTWAVLVITKLAQIVDDIPPHTLIDTFEVFSALSREFPLHAVYLKMSAGISRKFLDESKHYLVFRSEVIGTTLSLFMDSGTIGFGESGYYREGSLLFDLLL